MTGRFAALLAALTAFAPDALRADDLVPAGFRRVLPPAAGAQRRILVQIDPVEQARVLAVGMARPRAPVDVPAPPPSGAAGPLDWFWTAVPPGRGLGAGRFEGALVALGRGPGGAAVPAPRLEALAAIARAHGPEILRATVGTRVSPALVVALIGVESGGRADAVSPKGATGLMQLMPATAARFKVRDAADPGQNIAGGVAYLDWLMAAFDGDPLMVLAGYNAGEGAVQTSDGVPDYAETRAYVPRVLAAWTVARGLCLTPPVLVSDGCVFRAGAL